MSPTPTPAPDPGCIELLPIPPQPPRCPDVSGTVGDIAGTGVPASPNGIEQAQDQLQHLPAPSAADSTALHALIYPHGMTPVQIAALITVTAVVKVASANCGMPRGYGAKVEGNTVTVCPSGGGCPNPDGMLRETPRGDLGSALIASAIANNASFAAGMLLW